MFGRRIKLTRLQKLGRSLWPRSGFRRALRYTWHRVARLNDSAHRIALGFAAGTFMSFSPLIGTHVGGAALLAWIFGGNILASAAGTLVGNPLVFPLIWLSVYRLGYFLTGQGSARHPPEPIALSDLWHRPFETLEPVLWPLMVGGTLLGLVAGAVAYALVRAAVSGYQARRRERIDRKRVWPGQTLPYQAGAGSGREKVSQ